MVYDCERVAIYISNDLLSSRREKDECELVIAFSSLITLDAM